MSDPVEELLERYLDLRLGGAEIDVDRLLADGPSLDEAARERFLRLARLADVDGVREHADGERIGPYRLLRELGRGGQSVVFLAEDTRFQRRVALKVLSGRVLGRAGETSSRTSTARLRREAEVVSRLDHPSICVVYEMGADAGDHYIAMRYVEGETLAQRIAAARAAGARPASRKELDATLALVERAARALHAAHEAGVIHRDVKPANIMVTPSGDPVLLDFGLARDVESDAISLTADGGLVGTPAYMSPEQLSSARGAVDRRTDVYSLAVTLYECVTHQRPFDAPTREMLYRRILDDEPSRATRSNPSLPRDLDVVLETALAKSAHHRYQSALALAEDLRRVRAREPIRARPQGAWVRALRTAQRNPTAATTLALLFMTVVAALAVSLHLLDSARAARDVATARGLIGGAESAVIDNPCLALLLGIEGAKFAPGPAANDVLLRAIGALREKRMLETGHGPVIGFARSSSARFLATITPTEVRVWDASRWSLLATLGAHTGLVKNAVFSPDERRLATSAADGTLRIWRTSDWSCERVLQDEDLVVIASAFHATGERLLASSSSGDAPRGQATSWSARVWDVERGTVIQTLHADGPALSTVSFSPGGEHVVLAGHGTPTRVWRVTSQGAHVVLEIPNESGTSNPCAAVSPDERTLVVSAETGVDVWDLVTRRRRFRLASDTHLDAFAFRSDGARVLGVMETHPSRIWDLARGDLVCELAGARAKQLRSPCFSGDGTRVLAATWDRSASAWDAESGVELAVLSGHAAATIGACFSPSGDTAITAAVDGTIRDWSLTSESDRTTLWPTSGSFDVACFDPSGLGVAAATSRGQVEIVDVSSWSATATIQLPGVCRIHAISSSPRGDALLMVTQSVTADGRAGPREAAIWDLPTGELRVKLPHPPGSEVYDARLSSDGERVVTACDDGTARIWNAASGALLRDLVGHVGGVRSAAYDVAGTRVITCAEQDTDLTTRVWDVESGTQIAVLRATGLQPSVARLSPDGRWAAAGGWHGTVAVWDLASGTLHRSWSAHASHLRSLEFSPDGDRILTSGPDPGARVWDVDSGNAVMTIDPKRMAAIDASYSPDGDWIVTVWMDGAVRLYPADPLSRARRLAPRALTAAERAHYHLPDPSRR